MEIVKEHFTSLHQLINVLDSRHNNEVMEDENSSQTKGDKSWYGSSSYEEARDLLANGYTSILPKVMEKMKSMEKKLETEFQKAPKIYPQNKIEGFIPNVPNALLGLPNSMINIERIPQKQKTLDIVYEMGANCGQDPQLFIDAGIVLLTAIKILETKRISVKLVLGFMAGVASRQGDFPTVDLKDYGQRLDLQKLCFPLAHPSMFRRIGFKWLETNPNITDSEFACGYGRSPADDDDEWKEFIKKLNFSETTKVVRAQDIRNLDFDVMRLIDSFNIT